MAHEEPVEFDCEGLRLEGRLSLPRGTPSLALPRFAGEGTAASFAGEGTARGVVVCHPHPQYGGSMDNNVVDALVDHLQAAGAAALRFNFRGVGRSQGAYGNLVGECADARAAVALLRRRTGLRTVTLAGYSFGAMVALRVGHEDPGVDRLVAVAPPLAFFELDFLSACRKPILLVAGTRDSYCPAEAFRRAAESLPEAARAETVAGADHFFGGFEDAVGEAAVRFVYGTEALG
jgi:alpha/beta superfamily hydrolase